LNITLDQLISDFNKMQENEERWPHSFRSEELKKRWKSDFVLFYSPGRVISDEEFVSIRPLLVYYLKEMADEGETLIIRQAIGESYVAERRLQMQAAQTRLNRAFFELTEAFTGFIKVKLPDNGQRQTVLSAYFKLFGRLNQMVTVVKGINTKPDQTNGIEVKHMN
jgi:hypothetical protein